VVVAVGEIMLVEYYFFGTKASFAMNSMKNWEKIKHNQQALKPFLVREQVVDSIRRFFKQEGFREVETPLMVKHPGTEPYLEVFETELRLLGQQPERAFMLTSPEFAMKKLLAAGMGSIFQICKSFRNEEGLSSFHNPEFTILEWYRVNADYTDVMEDCEKLLLSILRSVTGSSSATKLEYQGEPYELSAPWERISVAEAFAKFAQVKPDELLERQALIEAAARKGLQVNADTSWEEAYHQIFLNEIEPHLGKTGPTIIYDYPASQAALSRRKKSDPRFAERFEFYLAGLELGNAFSELTDWQEQEERLQEDLMLRDKLGKTPYSLDSDFIEALKSGLPNTGGIAVGVDRLVMLFADTPAVRDTLLFPVDEVFGFSQDE
jgi:elongation factor P--(R)-beta-lysine ligase